VKSYTLALFALFVCASVCAGSSKSSTAQPTPSNSASVPDDFTNTPVQKVNDPLQGFNREIFRINNTLYKYALRPLAHGYAAVVPTPVRTGITNIFDNAQYPVRFINCVLEGKIKRSAQETGKFLVNSTVGLGGWMRPSEHMSAIANVPAADFGQTLSVWGLSTGPYLVVPVLGPSDCRDLVGYAGDFVMYPLNWHAIGLIHHAFISNTINLSLGAARFVNGLPKAVDTYDQITSAAVDPYIAVRDGFLTLRAAQVKK
jgi:phospholipid-binding lipoprotein MlaA